MPDILDHPVGPYFAVLSHRREAGWN